MPVSKLSFFSYNKAFNELFSKLLLYNLTELKFFKNRAKFDNCHFEGDHTTILPASRSLSQRGKNERKERDLCWPPLRNRTCRNASRVNTNFFQSNVTPVICRWKLVKHRYCFGAIEEQKITERSSYAVLKRVA